MRAAVRAVPACCCYCCRRGWNHGAAAAADPPSSSSLPHPLPPPPQADFGLSKHKYNTFCSNVHDLRGTLPYMAPEMIMDHTHVTGAHRLCCALLGL